MHKPFSTILIPLMFLISTLNTSASLIGVYGRLSPIYAWNAEGKNAISTKNLGGSANFSWQINRTEEIDWDFLWGSQQIGLSGGFPVLSTSWKHLFPLSHNVQMYGGLGCGIRMREFRLSERVIMPLVTGGIIYRHTPKLCIEFFCKRYLVFEDTTRLNKSSLRNKVKGDIPVMGVSVGYYLF